MQFFSLTSLNLNRESQLFIAVPKHMSHKNKITNCIKQTTCRSLTNKIRFLHKKKVSNKPVVYFSSSCIPLHVLILIKIRSCPANLVLVLVLFFSLNNLQMTQKVLM